MNQTATATGRPTRSRTAAYPATVKQQAMTSRWKGLPP